MHIASTIVVAVLQAHAVTWNPPARFDHSYPGKLTVERLAAKDVPAACAAMNPISFLLKGPDRGCAHHAFGRCRVIIPTSPIGGASPQAILRHEIGHCNGWPASHPA